MRRIGDIPDAVQIITPGGTAAGDTSPAPDRDRLLGEIDHLRSRLVGREARLVEVEAELTAVRRVREAEVRHLDSRVADLEKLYLQLLQRDERIADLEAQLRAAGAAHDTPGAGGPPADTAGRTGPSVESFGDREAWFRRRLQERADDETARLGDTVAHQRAVLDEKETLIRRLFDRIGISAEEITGPDDLKCISGVGPSIERMLHDLDITTFEQIAAFGDDDIDRVAEELGAFSYRVRSDHWVDQAHELARQKVAGGLLLPSSEPL